MVKNITGASNVTEYQLVKFSQANRVYQDEILSLYIKYAIEFNIQVDVAYVMCLLYTDFFTKEIEGNNIIGIGMQSGGTKMETFNSIEACIIAHFELLHKITSGDSIENPHSNLYRRIEADSATYSIDAYKIFEYDKYTTHTIYEFSTLIREINRTRKENVGWAESDNFYYCIRVKTSKSKQEIIKLRSELINKKFDPKTLFITSSNGMYTLEAGRYTNPINTNTLLRNLRMFGYNGEMEFRRK